MQPMHGEKKRSNKDSDQRRKEETAVVLCPYSTAVISVSVWPAAHPALTQVSLILANAAAVTEQNRGGKA